ncbi:MAG: DUF362 domain-containing protein [Chloroflexota bacterium]|jgi:uncharacterized protein (DUF362 family)|nr:DUF362 domain-containing protein [Chloroflexota bacterium]MDP6757823.1 DUF362 domain-containing protein [Chloroflexota bacterium]
MAGTKVALQTCSIDASQEQVRAVVARTIAAAGGMPEAVLTAKTIVIKPNWVGILVAETPDQVKRHRGRLVNDTDPQVTEAVVSLVRAANPSATIYVAEGLDKFHDWDPQQCWELMEARPLRENYGVELIHTDEGDIVDVPVPGGGLIRRFIEMRAEIANADAVISVAKIKCHQNAGITLSTKNLFGLVPASHYGSMNRNFLHQNPFRLMRFFVDLATTIKPDLAVIDGILGANYTMEGEAYETEVMLAGHDHVATDAVAMRVMGYDPAANHPTHPFETAENHVKLCAAAGLGTIDPNEIEVVGPSPESFGYQFETHVAFPADATDAMFAAARSASQTYLRLKDELLTTHRGQYVFIVGDEIVGSIDDLKGVPQLGFFAHEKGYGYAVQVLPDNEQPEIIEAYAG